MYHSDIDSGHKKSLAKDFFISQKNKQHSWKRMLFVTNKIKNSSQLFLLF